MNWIAFIPLIVKLIELAERYFAGPGHGAEKKELVTEVLKAAVNTTAAVSTGGQKETWTRIAPEVSTIIDASVSIMFPNETINQQPSG